MGAFEDLSARTRAQERKLPVLKANLARALPHLSQNCGVLSSDEIMGIDPTPRGKSHTIWLTDANNTNGPIELDQRQGIRLISGVTFAVQLNAIPQQRGTSCFYAWNLLRLELCGRFDPDSIPNKIINFARGNDAYQMINFIAHKAGTPPCFDIRREPPPTLDAYVSVEKLLESRSFVLSLSTDVQEFHNFLSAPNN